MSKPDGSNPAEPATDSKQPEATQTEHPVGAKQAAENDDIDSDS